ncbi:MAG: hypothetical protein WD751_02365 [Anaerolineales bacterium]
MEYNLRALYPFAHEIIVVEGATRAAKSLATAGGHSTDGTLEMLHEFKRGQDPDKKIQVITAADEGYADGFWPEKEEMSGAYARRISGQWLWQVDSDEFYLEADMAAVLSLLEAEPGISTISFPYFELFGGFSSTITGSWHLHQQTLCHRIFRWGEGYRYSAHRPPTVTDADGKDLRKGHWVSYPQNGAKPIYMFHYSYIFPKQAHQKVGYYSNVHWTSVFRKNEQWMEESYQRLKKPMFLGEKGWPNLQWLEPYRGEHPEAIMALQEDLASGKIAEPTRDTKDIERLLRSPVYAMEKRLARVFLAVYWPLRSAWKRLRGLVMRPSA